MLNRAVLTGRLANEPVLKTTRENKDICSFLLAVEKPFYLQELKEQKQNTEAFFIDVVCFNQQAKFIANQHKGDLVGVDGYIATKNFTDSQGIVRKATELVCDKVELIQHKKVSNNPYKQV